MRPHAPSTAFLAPPPERLRTQDFPLSGGRSGSAGLCILPLLPTADVLPGPQSSGDPGQCSVKPQSESLWARAHTADTPTHPCTGAQTRVHTDAHMHMHTCTCTTHINAHTPGELTPRGTRAHVCTSRHKHTCTRARSRTRRHTEAHVRTHMDTCTHARTRTGTGTHRGDQRCIIALQNGDDFCTGQTAPTLARFQRTPEGDSTQHPPSAEGRPRLRLQSCVHAEPGAHSVGTASGMEWGRPVVLCAPRLVPRLSAGLCGLPQPRLTGPSQSELLPRGSAAGWCSGRASPGLPPQLRAPGLAVRPAGSASGCPPPSSPAPRT